MSPEKEAAVEAARADARTRAVFEVVGRPLGRNGRTFKPGARIKLSRVDGELLAAMGRVVPAKGKAKAGDGDDAELPADTQASE